MKNDHLQQEPLKNVNLGMNEKLGVDPPPSPTTPTSHRQLFCNLRQVHPYGETTSLLRTHAYCKTHAYYDMSYHNVKLIPRLTFFNGSCLRWSFGFFDPRFFVNSKVDIFQWLLLEMVIWMEMTPDFSLIPRLTFFNGSCLRWSFGWKFFFFQYNKDVRPYFTLSK